MKWFLILIAVFALGYVLASRKQVKSFNQQQSENKESNKRKIIENLSGKFTNTDVENLLSVSDATATRYLEELEKERKLVQVGKTGKHVYYERA